MMVACRPASFVCGRPRRSFTQALAYINLAGSLRRWSSGPPSRRIHHTSKLALDLLSHTGPSAPRSALVLAAMMKTVRRQ